MPPRCARARAHALAGLLWGARGHVQDLLSLFARQGLSASSSLNGNYTMSEWAVSSNMVKAGPSSTLLLHLYCTASRVFSFVATACTQAKHSRMLTDWRCTGIRVSLILSSLDPKPSSLIPVPLHAAGRRGADEAEQWGQVRVAAAFDSPDTLQSATAFLREYGADTDAHAACAVVPRSCIAYPQVRRLRSVA